MRMLSNVLFLGGLALVFVGITSAIGVSVAGVLATAAAVAALLYAGAVWFGGAVASKKTPSATTSSENTCATVSGPATRTLTLTNSSANRNDPTSTK